MLTIERFFALLLGPSGRYLSGLWTPSEILQHMFPRSKIDVSCDVAARIINGVLPFPAIYAAAYCDEDGLNNLKFDLCEFVKRYHSRAMLQDMNLRLHLEVISSELPAEQIAELECYYVTDNPSRYDIGIYFAHILHYLLLK